MKKLLFLLIAGIVAGQIANAQCNKKMVWTASKAEFLDDAGNVQDTKNVEVIVHTNNQKIVVIHNDEPGDSLWGPVKAVNCEWKPSAKDGKITFNASLSETNNADMKSSLVIETKDAKTSILLTFEREDGTKKSVRIPIDKYAEEK